MPAPSLFPESVTRARLTNYIFINAGMNARRDAPTPVGVRRREMCMACHASSVTGLGLSAAVNAASPLQCRRPRLPLTKFK